MISAFANALPLPRNREATTLYFVHAQRRKKSSSHFIFSSCPHTRNALLTLLFPLLSSRIVRMLHAPPQSAAANEDEENPEVAADSDDDSQEHDDEESIEVKGFVAPVGEEPPPPPRRLASPKQEGGDKKSRLPSLSIAEAIAGVKANAKAKFVETVDIAVRLGIDPKRSDMIVRGVANLPHGTGKKIRVCVFAEGEQADEARAAGADVVGGEELIAEIKSLGVGAIDFDKAIAHPAIMPKLSAIARVLGPRGMMPNPKVGTLTANITQAVAAMRLGRVEFRAEKGAIVHACVGKVDFEDSQLEENVAAFMSVILDLRPKNVKGAPAASSYLKGASLSSTMGKGSFRIQKDSLVQAAAAWSKL